LETNENNRDTVQALGKRILKHKVTVLWAVTLWERQ